MNVGLSRSKLLLGNKKLQRGALMKLNLRQQLKQFEHLLQSSLFPVIEVELGELSEPSRRLE